MDLFKKFLNTTGKTYQAADRYLFGGILPGGVVNNQESFGDFIERDNRNKERFRKRIAQDPLYSDVNYSVPPPINTGQAILMDAAASSIAGAQPYIEKGIKASPEKFQKLLSTGLNKLPFSANLFARYYTGIGDKGLKIPSDIKNQISKKLNDPNNLNKFKEYHIKKEKELNEIMQSTLGNMDRKMFNDQLAEVRSNLKRVEAGDIPYSGYGDTRKDNPLHATDTSIGRAWFKENPNFYTTNETYDFAYANQDEDESRFIGPPMYIAPTPSQRSILDAVVPERIMTPGLIQGPLILSASAKPLTNFGRAIVQKLPDKSFKYNINIPKNK